MATSAIKVIFDEGAAPSTPASAKSVIYAKSDGLMYSKDDAGVETLMSSGASSGIPATIFDVKGDIIVASAADTAARLAAGTNGHVLTANSGATNGIEWAAPASSTTPVAADVTRTAGDFTTSSTTFVDVTSMSLTVTTLARRVKIGFVGCGYVNNAAGTMAVDLDIDGARVGGTDGLWGYGQVAASENMNMSFTYLTAAPLTAASHTFKLQIKVFNGAHAGVVSATTSLPAYFWVEESMATA